MRNRRRLWVAGSILIGAALGTRLVVLIPPLRWAWGELLAAVTPPCRDLVSNTFQMCAPRWPTGLAILAPRALFGWIFGAVTLGRSRVA
jgi:hypothetical protein